MPKVKEEHYENKKQEILEAAKRVALKKPIYHVTMRDVVLEAGMSQGGVYKYFSNIDVLFAALLGQNSLTSEVKDEIDAIFAENKDPMQVLHVFLTYVGAYIETSVSGSGKIIHELMAFYANEPERFEKVSSQLLRASTLGYLHTAFSCFLQEQVAAKKFSPAVPLEEVIAFMATTINGIVHDAIMAQNAAYARHLMPAPNVKRLVYSLYLAVISILGAGKR
ncbi:TetR family transcriptional regulator [Paenibacillus swuensis]|uniref:TetR family transcriptional regulator n=1 Tax=Paenibacillus swuensis TaxID=1178515 RepID=A0A172TJJ8_9BACL|nr:TetR/AcrR family transcriptional regulator [Paenibacillus swuensis]ANE47229.1 TetR family transcriptional regulator [Paenibacillus swuensis]